MANKTKSVVTESVVSPELAFLDAMITRVQSAQRRC